MKIDKSKVISVTNERFRLKYHVSTPSGWMNDPNGFVYFKGYYHVFYQYYPYDSSWGPMHWGHARSKDLVTWESLPAALIPGDPEDQDGCFSGSATVKDNKLYLIYTGHHYYGDSDPDHFWQNQNLAISEDGINFKKYENNPIIAKPPVDNSHHFRDPKVWERDGEFYLIIGSQNNLGCGRVILYTSKDLLHWDYAGPVTSASTAKDGFMWECPDLFRLNGQDILLYSPQGIQKDDTNYLNLYQTGYLVGELDYHNKQMSHGNFTELDRGHDFYATQTMLAPDGRRILFGWMDMWEAEMPEKADGWAGALTLPRELTLKNQKLFMKPVKELVNLRSHQLLDTVLTDTHHSFEPFKTNQLELNFNIDISQQFENQVKINLTAQSGNKLSLEINTKTGEVILFRSGDDPYRYGNLQLGSVKSLPIQVFVDTSSVEFFINDGEVVFSERFYHEDYLSLSIRNKNNTTIKTQIYQLK